MREILVKPLGLVTRPNEYGQYPIGGLLTAQNLVMRAPGIIESAPNLVLGVSFGASNEVVHDLLPLANGKMSSLTRTSGGTWSHRVNATASTYAQPLFAPITWSTSGRNSPVVMRGRALYNSQTKGVLVMDSLDPTPPASLRRAGLPQASLYVNNFASTNAVALATNCCVGYAACMRRVFSDGYEIQSKPSPIVGVLNGGAVANPVLAVGCANSDGWLAGDILEVYRTNIVTGATTSTDPGTTLNKIYSRTLTATDVLGAQILVEDTTQPGPLGVTDGEGLYTNPGNKGLLGGHRQPDICQCMAVFKNYLFCADLTERPRLKFQIPGGLFATESSPGTWDTAAFRKNGIGSRRANGTVTNGNASITGVSAAHMVGIVQGQQYQAGFGGASFPFGTTVLSAVGTTITMSANATGSGTGITVNDVIEIAGFTYYIFSTQTSLIEWLMGTEHLEVTMSQNALGLENPAAGLTDPTWIIEPIVPDTTANFTVRATNGQNYKPQLTEFALTATTLPYKRTRNLLKWSNDSQPEHFPAPNEAQVGVGEIIAMESTRDALWIFCTDGLYRLSGAGGQWRVDTADTTMVLASPRASCVLREAVYAYTNQGLVRITDAGSENLTDRIIGDLLPGSEYTETASVIIAANEQDEEVVLRIGPFEVYVYSVRENAFTTVLHEDVTAMAYARYPVSGLPALAFGQSPSGSAPSYSLWNATTSFKAAAARFQPLFDQNPFIAKQWIDGVWVFDAGSIGKSLTVNWNGTNSPASLLKGGGQYFNESRAVFGVPRRAATAHTLAPGFSVPVHSTATRLQALSVRFVQLSEQNLQRT